MKKMSNKQPENMEIKSTTYGLKEIKIPELNMTVWVKPHKTEEDIRAKYLAEKEVKTTAHLRYKKKEQS